MNLHLPREICRNIADALHREWLVTNGIGGYACGTVAGGLTRRYHGLLIAALDPPTKQTLLVTRLDEGVRVGDEEHLIYTSVWGGGVSDPAGWRYIERFDLNWGIPTWTYNVAGATLRKSIWMEAGRNVTYVRYELAADAPPVALNCRLLVNCRDSHRLSGRGGRSFQVHASANRVQVRTEGLERPISAAGTVTGAGQVTWQLDHTWYRGFHLSQEAVRGFDHREDHLSAAMAQVPLQPGETVTFTLHIGDEPPKDVRGALERATLRARDSVARWEALCAPAGVTPPAPVRQLALSAEQFVVRRPYPDAPDGYTVLAGYPWLADWGRDIFVALPGLLLTTGRWDIARQILRTWARFVDHGMLPNRLPDGKHAPAYQSADVALWYVWAVDQYVRTTHDLDTLRTLWPALQEIVAHYRTGTRHTIHVADDGLLYAGQDGLALTWMDARVGDRLITPRRGKPIELNALWYDALANLARLADLLGEDDREYTQLAARARWSFPRFWNAERACCFDVIDGPDGADRAVRPNQIFAVALAHSPFPWERQEAIVRCCEQDLLTWFGLRSLAPAERGYAARYVGGTVERDEAFHLGTAWGWLLGAFVIAHFRVHHDAQRCREFLDPMLGQLWMRGVGSLSEVFDGETPHLAGGCPAQAWSIAETLRAWHVTQCGATRCP